DEQAAALFAKQGLTPDLVQAYIAAAHHQKAVASKEATKAEILSGYATGFIPHDAAIANLGKLGWQPPEAEFELAMVDFRPAEQGLSQLQGMGYSPFEAWVLLSDALNAPVTDRPPPADVPTAYTQGP